jgi:hypothetical protein
MTSVHSLTAQLPRVIVDVQRIDPEQRNYAVGGKHRVELTFEQMVLLRDGQLVLDVQGM